MIISPSKIRDNALALAGNKRGATRIANKACSFFGVIQREDRWVCKNGLHNMCRYYMLENNNLFAPWLAQRATDKQTIGIYIAKTTTQSWEIHARIDACADTGKLPQDVREIAVVRNQNIAQIKRYIESAQRNLGTTFCFVHDESGRLDEHCALKSKDIKKISVPLQLDDAILDEDAIANKTAYSIRYCGEDADDRVVELYRYAAGSVCRNALYDMADHLFGSFAAYALFDDANLSKKFVHAFTGGQENISFSYSPYKPTQPQIAPIAAAENASYNLPDTVCDPRAFLFEDSDVFLEILTDISEVVARGEGVEKIWSYIFDMMEKEDDDNLHMLNEMLYASTPLKNDKARMQKMIKLLGDISNAYGVSCMIDNLYSGVPLEDIIA